MNTVYKTKTRYDICNLIGYADNAYFSSRYLAPVLSAYKRKLDNLFIEDHMRTLLGELRKSIDESIKMEPTIRHSFLS